MDSHLDSVDRDGIARDARRRPGSTPAAARRVATVVTSADYRFNWIVALDERGDCRGAIHFSKWLGSSGEQHRFFGVHVPPDGGDADETEAQTRAVVKSARAESVFRDIVRTEPNTHPSEILTEIDPSVAAGLVVSRRADTDGPSLIRLGGMVRRIAEHTATPVAIVPHDLGPGQMSTGPVLIAIHPRQTPPDAARFARHLAASKGLQPLLVHVAHVDETGLLNASVDALQDAYARSEAEAAHALEQWAVRNGLASAWRVVVRGDVRFAIQTVAQRHDASMIVCGTRQRSIFARLLEPSRALELARYARRPVVLVPRSDDESVSAGDGGREIGPFTWANALR